MFTNTGRRPLSLDLERGRLELDVRGPSLGHERSDRRPAPRNRRPVIPPRGRLRFKLPFPGTVGERRFRLGKPGWYWLLLSFRCPASDAERTWSGEVRSRPLWIAYR